VRCEIRSDGPDERFLRFEQREPECGEDFCDCCGDCLSCYGDDGCYDGSDEAGVHRWIKYEPVSDVPTVAEGK
jgi:hypothetical protein